MSPTQQGGCLCGSVRYEVSAEPVRITICHCKYCQRSTGSAYLVEPIFNRTDFKLIRGTTRTYSHASAGSGKQITINFCETCGTKLYLDLERFPDIYGVFGGTFDNPNWFARPPEKSRHIFLDFAQKGTVVPAGYATFRLHAVNNDGAPADPTVYDEPRQID